MISSTLDLSAVQDLRYISLSSLHNGPIAIRNFTSGEFKYRPETAHYLADFNLINNSSIQFELPGYVHIEGGRYSPFIKFFKNIITFIIKNN